MTGYQEKQEFGKKKTRQEYGLVALLVIHSMYEKKTLLYIWIVPGISHDRSYLKHMIVMNTITLICQ